VSSKGLIWRIEIKTFSGSGIEPFLDPEDVLVRDGIEVGAFRQETSDKAIGVFDSAFLPRAVWVAKERLKRKGLIEEKMKSIFSTIVISERSDLSGQGA